MAAEKPKNTAPSPPEEYEVVRLPMRNPVGGQESEKAEPTSGKQAARKEG